MDLSIHQSNEMGLSIQPNDEMDLSTHQSNEMGLSIQPDDEMDLSTYPDNEMDLSARPDNDSEIRARLSAKIPFDKKWEILKPVIRKLWIDEDQKLSELIQNIEASYNFSASDTQYKYRFKKWKWKKNIPTPKKQEIIKYRQSRAAAGRSTQLVYKGKNVDEKQLRRFLKQKVKAPGSIEDIGRELRWLTGSEFRLGNSIFLNWNIPYGAMRSRTGRSSSISANSPMQFSTPSDIVTVPTPASNAPSPNNAPSPLTKAKDKREMIDRAYMLIEGRHRDLVRSLRKEEREKMSQWLYQFWLYGFKTTKYWGRGPQTWNAARLRFLDHLFGSPVGFPSTPEMSLRNTLYQRTSSTLHEDDNTEKPSPLCRWSIHYKTDIKYERVPTRTPSPEPDFDDLVEESWKPWPSSLAQQSCQRVLTRGLAINSFSNIDTKDLPIAIPQIINQLEASGLEFLEETLGFSIMARNYEMTFDIRYKLGDSEEAKKIFRRLQPMHLAATFLDGSKSCCLVVYNLLISYEGTFRPPDVDNLGHTVFDKLMMTILKAHTSISPGTVDDGLRNEKRFPGEETDICGRWDADSDCVRALLVKGDPCIPFAWKHKFCHTSVQAICHYIDMLEAHYDIIGDKSIFEIPSGLFIKRCISCGLKMEIYPLHVIVLLAFLLAQSGTKDEDLFGMLALLLCMLRNRADPFSTATISASSLFDQEMVPMECDHEELRPIELADRVPASILRNWPQKTKVGWDVFCHTLRYAEQATLYKESSDYNPSECDGHGKEYDPDDVRSININKLETAVQTEYLTYRRLDENDPWLSPNFNMLEVLECLQTGKEISVALTRNEMIKPLCECGKLDSVDWRCPRAEDVMSHHFSNLEDWSRTTFVPDIHEYFLDED